MDNKKIIKTKETELKMLKILNKKGHVNNDLYKAVETKLTRQIEILKL
jgi:hypothetical protein